MALTHHDDIELVAGDSWTIIGTLLDENGAAFDLSGDDKVLMWTMRGADGATLTDLVADSTVSKLEPKTAGKFSIDVPPSATYSLEASRCHDFVRVSVGGVVIDTFWVGVIDVAADPQQLDQA